jgi:secondary thiamine-phosphate synthase enzyme
MQQHRTICSVSTKGQGLYEITAEAQQAVRDSAIAIGQLTAFVQHTSASLLIQENADPDVRHDLDQFFRRLVPEGQSWMVHTLEGPDDMPAHIRAALTQTSITIPIDAGRLGLGTWQGLYLYEHRRSPHRRKVIFHVIGE